MVTDSDGAAMISSAHKHHHQAGFSLVELIITASILGILSSIALVNLSSSWTSTRLSSTTRGLENWLSDQRRYATTHNLTCLITIDHTNKRLISTTYGSENSQPCTNSSLKASADVFDLVEEFGAGNNKLVLESTPSTDPSHTDGGILFSLQGLSQNHQLSSEGVLELRLTHADLQEQRCIRIISPIGMIRDGRSENSDSKCHYDKTI